MDQIRSTISELAAVEVETRPYGQRHSVHIDVTVDTAVVEACGWTVELSAKRLELELTFESANICKDDRFGTVIREPPAPTELTTSVDIQKEAAVSGSMALGMNVSSENMSGKAGASLETKGSAKIKESEVMQKKLSLSEHYVRRLPNNRWEIKEESEKPLEGTYIQFHNTLCYVNIVKPANRNAVIAHLKVRQRDLLMNVTDAPSMFSYRTDEKLFGILIAKRAEEGLNQTYKGYLTISEYEHDIPTQE